MARKTKSLLSEEFILDKAADLIESVGLEAFSLRKLAVDVGCEAMSLYHYFPSKSLLLDHLVDRSLKQVAFPPDHAEPLGAIKVVAREFRRVGLKRPKFFPYFALHRMNTPVGLLFLERCLRIFHRLGLSDQQAATFFRCLGYYLIGAVLEETSGYAQGPDSAGQQPDADDMASLYPLLAKAGAYFSPDHHSAIFEQGLNALLAELARLQVMAL